MRRVVFSEEAVRLFRAIPKAQQAHVKQGIRTHLQANDATEESRNKFRLRRASAWAEYELRLGDWRVFYRVSHETVEIILIGKKQGDRLRIGRKEVEL